MGPYRAFVKTTYRSIGMVLLTEAYLGSYLEEHGKLSVSTTPLKNIIFCAW